MSHRPNPKVVGKLLARARKEAGVQQRQMASAMGRGVRTMSRWEAGGGYPSRDEGDELAVILKNASGETWRAFVLACGLSLEDMLQKVPEQRAKLPPPPPPPREDLLSPSPPPLEAPAFPGAVLVVDPPRPPERVPDPPAASAEDALDELLRACAEELDVGPRKLRMALALLLAEAGAHGLSCDQARAVVLRRRPRLR